MLGPVQYVLVQKELESLRLEPQSTCVVSDRLHKYAIWIVFTLFIVCELFLDSLQLFIYLAQIEPDNRVKRRHLVKLSLSFIDNLPRHNLGLLNDFFIYLLLLGEDFQAVSLLNLNVMALLHAQACRVAFGRSCRRQPTAIRLPGQLITDPRLMTLPVCS